MRTLVLLAVAAFSIACQPTPVPVQPDGMTDAAPPPPPPSDAAPPPAASDAVSPPTPTLPPSPPPAPSVAVDSGAPSCASACANVATKVTQCPEGHYADCAATCATVQGDVHQVHPNLAKLTAAKTVADVRAAGWSCRTDGG